MGWHHFARKNQFSQLFPPKWNYMNLIYRFSDFSTEKYGFTSSHCLSWLFIYLHVKQVHPFCELWIGAIPKFPKLSSLWIHRHSIERVLKNVINKCINWIKLLRDFKHILPKLQIINFLWPFKISLFYPFPSPQKLFAHNTKRSVESVFSSIQVSQLGRNSGLPMLSILVFLCLEPVKQPD